jgi:two-component system repressor protein LuxO
MSGPACSQKTVLIIEDRCSVASAYRAHLEAEGYSCALADCADAAAAALESDPPFIALVSLELPGCNPAELITRSKALAPQTVIIAIAANASINAAVDAVRAGAWDYLVKPVSRNRLITTLSNATNQTQSRPSNSAKLVSQPVTMLGSSAAMEDLQRRISAIAASSAPAFITGESGTGKELCAEAIHRASPRADKPFVALNCGAIPHDLMESEIFGHLKGAFTGAISEREGAAAAAHGGTLFLDEICELDLHLQTKLLRFLQTGTIQPVGSSHVRKVDIRIVCATNRTPQTEVAEGRFREDLFFRLHVLPVSLEPLRARGGDVIELARNFVRQFAREEQKSFTSLGECAVERLRSHHWPGNVRELQNVIRQAIVLHDGTVLDADMLPDYLGTPAAQSPHAAQTPAAMLDGRLLWQIERDVIEAAISRFAGSIPKAADALGISPSTIYRKRETWAAMPA